MPKNSHLERRAKEKLVTLVKAIDAVVVSQLAQFDADEINYVLEKHSQHLKYDLSRDFENIRTQNLTESPFDDLFNN